MKTIKVLVTKETIQESEYFDNENCAICKTLRRLGYGIVSAGGHYIGGSDGRKYEFLNNTHLDLSQEFTKKDFGKPYGDVICELQEPPKASEPKERIVYVMVDSTVKELSGQLTNN